MFSLCLLLLAAPVGCSREPADSAPQPPKQVWLAASHILIQYVGAASSAEGVTRTKDEALKLADRLAAEARSGADFAELARQHSDGPTGPGGGSLGDFPSTRMVPAFSLATALLAVGEVSDPVETKFGFHVIRRDREVEIVGARHILVMHSGSPRKPDSVTRTPEEAQVRAAETLGKARSGRDFGELAAEYSDGPTRVKGGDLGTFPRGGRMGPAFDAAVFGLEVGAISDIVETQFGYHIILRYE